MAAYGCTAYRVGFDGMVVTDWGAVLLKNEDHILPVNTEDMVLIGYMAKNFRYQGAGSSHYKYRKAGRRRSGAALYRAATAGSTPPSEGIKGICQSRIATG